MKTLSVSIELSKLAIEAEGEMLAPKEWVSNMKKVLSKHEDIVGGFRESQLKNSKSLGEDLRLSEYQLNYEKSSLLFQLVNFSPRGEWQVQGFRFV